MSETSLEVPSAIGQTPGTELQTANRTAINKADQDPDSRIADSAQAEEVAYAEKPARDLAREGDITPEEKVTLDNIAERKGEIKYKELQSLSAERKQQYQVVRRKEMAIQNTVQELQTLRQSLGLPQPANEDSAIVHLRQEMQISLDHVNTTTHQIELEVRYYAPVMVEYLRMSLLQRMINRYFEIFRSLSPADLDSLEHAGKKAGGDSAFQEGQGQLQPDSLRLFVKAFKTGSRQLGDVVKAMPGFVVELGSTMGPELEQQAQAQLARQVEEPSAKSSAAGNANESAFSWSDEDETAAYAQNSAIDSARPEPATAPVEAAQTETVATPVAAAETPSPQAEAPVEAQPQPEAPEQRARYSRVEAARRIGRGMTRFSGVRPGLWSGMKRLATKGAEAGSKAMDFTIAAGANTAKWAGELANRAGDTLGVGLDFVDDNYEKAVEWTKEKVANASEWTEPKYKFVSIYGERGVNRIRARGAQSEARFRQGIGDARNFGNTMRQRQREGNVNTERIRLTEMRGLLQTRLESIDRRLAQLDAANNLREQLVSLREAA